MASHYPYSPVSSLSDIINEVDGPSRQSQVSPCPSEAASEHSLEPISMVDRPSQQIQRSPSPQDMTRESTPTPEDPKPDAKSAKKEFDWASSWIWETGGAALSIICIALLIGFLAYVNGKPYPDWEYQASPNTIVSIIVTVAKAAMLVPVSSCLSQLKWTQYRTPRPLYHMHVLDEASRGPWGAFQLLWVSTPSLATVGAVLTILALAIDPFAQQILAYPSHEVLSANETAYVQKTEAYAPGMRGEERGKGALSASMQIAMLNGLSDTSAPLEPVCTSASCRYPDFVSLGICSRCEEVTNQVNQTCTPNQEPLSQTSVLDGLLDGLVKHPPSVYRDTPMNCTYTSPQGLQYMTDNSVFLVYNDTLELRRYDWTSVTKGNSDEIFGIPGPITSLLEVKYAHDWTIYTPDNATAVEEKPNITECGVFFCEKAYTQNHFSLDHRQVQPSKSQPLFPERSKSTVSLSPPPGTKMLSENSTHAVDLVTLGFLKNELTARLNITGFSLFSTARFALYIILSHRNNISESLNSLTTSMTDVIRACQNSTQVPGQAFRTTSFISVRWPWIIPPIVTVLLSALLLIVTAMTNRRLHAVGWKSCVLELLAGRLETRPEHDLGSLRNVDEVQRMSKKIKVTMEEYGGGC